MWLIINFQGGNILLISCKNNENWHFMTVWVSPVVQSTSPFHWRETPTCYTSTPMSTELYLLGAVLLQYVVVLKREPEQEIATSSEWTQLWTPIPLFEQERRHDSLPKQPTLSSQIGPDPEPYLQKSDVGWSHVMMTIRFQKIRRQYASLTWSVCLVFIYTDLLTPAFSAYSSRSGKTHRV